MSKRKRKQQLVKVILGGDTGTVVGPADPILVKLREVVDELCDERPCYCPFCQQDVISEEKRCPDCGAPMWGQVTMPEGWEPGMKSETAETACGPLDNPNLKAAEQISAQLNDLTRAVWHLTMAMQRFGVITDRLADVLEKQKP